MCTCDVYVYICICIYICIYVDMLAAATFEIELIPIQDGSIQIQL